mmetsp:Transcript_765/g.955  ORF Transcript_765/g.955 Transcript_765/m.955 type:complete len:189 (+) Transcript_765:1203-1769(+)
MVPTVNPPAFTGSRNVVVIETVIEDTGVGMSRHKQRQLFKMFNNAKREANKLNRSFSKDTVGKSSTSLVNRKSAEGNGLGLFLSLQLAKYLNGDIMIESTPGKGTTAKMYILVEIDRSFSITSSIQAPSLSEQPQRRKKQSFKTLYKWYKQQPGFVTKDVNNRQTPRRQRSFSQPNNSGFSSIKRKSY